MRRCQLFWVVMLLWAVSWVASPTAAAEALRLKVKSAIVMDLTSGQILFEQNADAHIPPASLTKVLTLYLAFDEVVAGRVRLTDKVRVSERAADEGGSSMKLAAGESVEFYELLKGMAVASGNDASIAVAQHLAPDVDTFVKRMNRKAKAIGMRDSRFVNPNGLPVKGQTTTARDMLALAASYLQRHPEALKIHGLASITHNDFTRRNSNHLLGEVEGVDGLKTGYVDASGYNIIVSAKRGGHRIVAVVLGGASSRQRNREAKRVLEAGFHKVGAPKPVYANAPGKRANGQAKAEDASGSRDPLSVAARAILDKNKAPENKNTDTAGQRTLLYASAGPTLRAGVEASPAPAVQYPAEFPDAAPDSEQNLASAAVSAAIDDQAVAALAASIVVSNGATRSAVPAEKRPQGTYALAESTWKSRDKATERVSTLRRQGLQAYAMRSSSGKSATYRVLIGMYESARDAEASKRTLAHRYNLKLAVVTGSS